MSAPVRSSSSHGFELGGTPISPGQRTPIPCSRRAWKSASEKCPTQTEDEFFKRIGGGPVAMTSMTRGRGFLNSFQPDAHCLAYFYHLHPEHRTVDVLNPFQLDP